MFMLVVFGRKRNLIKYTSNATASETGIVCDVHALEICFCWFRLEIIFMGTDVCTHACKFETRLIQSCVHSPFTWLQTTICIMHVLTPCLTRHTYELHVNRNARSKKRAHTSMLTDYKIRNHNICDSHFSLNLSLLFCTPKNRHTCRASDWAMYLPWTCSLRVRRARTLNIVARVLYEHEDYAPLHECPCVCVWCVCFEGSKISCIFYM